MKMTREQQFVIELSKRLPPVIFKEVLKDARSGRMAFARDLMQWGPRRQHKRL